MSNHWEFVEKGFPDRAEMGRKLGHSEDPAGTVWTLLQSGSLQFGSHAESTTYLVPISFEVRLNTQNPKTGPSHGCPATRKPAFCWEDLFCSDSGPNLRETVPTCPNNFLRAFPAKPSWTQRKWCSINPIVFTGTSLPQFRQHSHLDNRSIQYSNIAHTFSRSFKSQWFLSQMV